MAGKAATKKLAATQNNDAAANENGVGDMPAEAVAQKEVEPKVDAKKRGRPAAAKAEGGAKDKAVAAPAAAKGKGRPAAAAKEAPKQNGSSAAVETKKVEEKKVEEEDEEEDVEENGEGDISPAKKGRGRPPKKAGTMTTSGKPRGRPKKV
jgi:hypothetical protein